MRSQYHPVRTAFEARRDIHAVPKQIALFGNHITEIDPCPEDDAFALWNVGIAAHHATLHFDGTADRFDGAGELDQHTVAGCLHDASAMLLDPRIDEFAPMRLQPGESAFLVGSHQAAVKRPRRPP